MIQKIQYAVDEIRQNGQNADWWKGRFRERVWRPVVWPAYGKLHGERDGIRVMDEDWDVLIVVDSCRYDLFEQVVDLTRFDDYQRVDSLGGATQEWTWNNFDGDDDGSALADTVYVNANPVVSQNVGTAFAAFHDVWRDHFSEDLNTVPPEPVTDTALDAAADHPDKRLIVHYLQPHVPFVNHPELQFTRFMGGRVDERAATAWEAVGQGLISESELWEGYRDNLEMVLPEVNRLIDGLDGKKIVFTSDHGNVCGERPKHYPLKLYGHRPYFRHPLLTRVPWGVIDKRDPERGVREHADDDITERLSALGYK